MSRAKPFISICAVAILMCTALAAQSAPHPLDPLSGEEISQTVDILRTAGHINDSSRFPIITLQEPAKADVLAWKPGMEMRRMASVMVRVGAKVYEADVDLSAGKVTRWIHKAGVESPIMLEEWSAAQQIALADARMVEGLKKRGITDLGQPVTHRGEQGIPVIAVRENRNLMRNDLSQLPWQKGQFIHVDNYLEAVGVMNALKAGVTLESVRRPISATMVRKAIEKRDKFAAGAE